MPRTCSPRPPSSSNGCARHRTHPTEPLSHPFRYFTADEAGTDPGGASSANPVSLEIYPPGGFMTLVIPFLSDTWIADERGTYDQVTDIR